MGNCRSRLLYYSPRHTQPPIHSHMPTFTYSFLHHHHITTLQQSRIDENSRLSNNLKCQASPSQQLPLSPPHSPPPPPPRPPPPRHRAPYISTAAPTAPSRSPTRQRLSCSASATTRPSATSAACPSPRSQLAVTEARRC